MAESISNPPHDHSQNENSLDTAVNVSFETWETHREKIADLYIQRNLTLDKVMETMRGLGVRATKAQYKQKFSEWNLKKNLNHSDAQALLHERTRRARLGRTDTEFRNSIGKPFNPARLDRYMSRRNARTDARAELAMQHQQHPAAHSSRAPSVRGAVPSPNVQTRNASQAPAVERPPPDIFSPPQSQPFSASNSLENFGYRDFMSEAAGGVDTSFLEPQNSVNAWAMGMPMDRGMAFYPFPAGLAEYQLPVQNYSEGRRNIAFALPQNHVPFAQDQHGQIPNADSFWPQNTSTMEPVYGHQVQAPQTPNILPVAIDDDLEEDSPGGTGGPDVETETSTTNVVQNTRSKKRQPIHQAAQQGSLEIVKLLVGRQPACADVQGAKDGVTALWLAAQQGHIDIVQLLLEYKVNVNTRVRDSGRRPIHQAAQNGHLEVVKLLLSHSADMDPADDKGVTPLLAASHQGHVEIVRLLLQKGADVKATTSDAFRQPIHQAVQNDHFATTELLLEWGAQAEQSEGYDDTVPSPLWLAAQQGNNRIATLLVAKGANVNSLIMPSLRRPIHQAAQNNHNDILKLLLQNGAEVDACEEDGWTPLIIASQQGHLEVVKSLLENGAKINAEEKDGATSLWLASQQGHLEIVQLLLERDAKSLATRSSLRKPIHQAAQNGHPEVVRLLLEHFGKESELDVEEVKRVTPLFLASQGTEEGHLKVVQYLSGQGAKIVLE